MDGKVAEIKEIEKLIEKALWSQEVNDEIEEAFDAYQVAEIKLGEIIVSNDEPVYFEKQRVLAYCLMRQSNLLRQMGKAEEALALGDREVAASRSFKGCYCLDTKSDVASDQPHHHRRCKNWSRYAGASFGSYLNVETAMITNKVWAGFGFFKLTWQMRG